MQKLFVFFYLVDYMRVMSILFCVEFNVTSPGQNVSSKVFYVLFQWTFHNKSLFTFITLTSWAILQIMSFCEFDLCFKNIQSLIKKIDTLTHTVHCKARLGS